MASLGSDPLVACEVGRRGVGALLFVNEGSALLEISSPAVSGVRDAPLVSTKLPWVSFVGGSSVLGTDSLEEEAKVISVLALE